MKEVRKDTEMKKDQPLLADEPNEYSHQGNEEPPLNSDEITSKEKVERLIKSGPRDALSTPDKN